MSIITVVDQDLKFKNVHIKDLREDYVYSLIQLGKLTQVVKKMSISVSELIEQLQQVKDKTLPVQLHIVTTKNELFVTDKFSVELIEYQLSDDQAVPFVSVVGNEVSNWY